MKEKKPAVFRKPGGRRIFVFDIPDDELEAWVKALKRNQKPKPGFIK